MPLRTILGLVILGLIAAVADDLYWRSQTAKPIEISDPANGAHRLVIRADSFNQCYIVATVRGSKPARLRFLLDSGADGVALTQQAARDLGFNTVTLPYNQTYQGWGLSGHLADITIREFRLNTLVLRDLRASVAQVSNPDEVSLLGANVLRMLNFQVRVGSCVVTFPTYARQQISS